jgi:hypothetical protein
MSKEPIFETEASMCDRFVDVIRNGKNTKDKWDVYCEHADWDLLLVHKETGTQIGLEAKLKLNAKVLSQCISRNYNTGPDYRAVLVPSDGLQNHFIELARYMLIPIVVVSKNNDRGSWYHISHNGYHIHMQSSAFPENDTPDVYWEERYWHPLLPVERLKVPEFASHHGAGNAAPIRMTEWKVSAIKLLIILERRGFVTRADMKALKLSPTRWTDGWTGFLILDRENGGWIKCRRTPDLKGQSPTSWAEIEAKHDEWFKALQIPEHLKLPLLDMPNGLIDASISASGGGASDGSA